MSVHILHIPFFHFVLYRYVLCAWNVVSCPTTLISSIVLWILLFFSDIYNMKKTQKSNIFKKKREGGGRELRSLLLYLVATISVVSPLNKAPSFESFS
jgi:hypothetical protein